MNGLYFRNVHLVGVGKKRQYTSVDAALKKILLDEQYIQTGKLQFPQRPLEASKIHVES